MSSQPLIFSTKPIILSKKPARSGWLHHGEHGRPRLDNAQFVIRERDNRACMSTQHGAADLVLFYWHRLSYDANLPPHLTTSVPAFPAAASSMESIEQITARFPPDLMNWSAASTLGPIEPAGKCPSLR